MAVFEPISEEEEDLDSKVLFSRFNPFRSAVVPGGLWTAKRRPFRKVDDLFPDFPMEVGGGRRKIATTQ